MAAAITAIPPTTPPAMAPTGALFFEAVVSVSGAEVGVEPPVDEPADEEDEVFIVVDAQCVNELLFALRLSLIITSRVKT